MVAVVTAFSRVAELESQCIARALRRRDSEFIGRMVSRYHYRLLRYLVYWTSRREQAEGFSPAAQLKGTLDEATRRHVWVPFENVFLDLMSGRREDRVAFQDLLVLARSGRIAVVIVLHTSRWARNALISRKYKDELRGRGVEVIATNAPFDVARPEGKFAERMMEAVESSLRARSDVGRRARGSP